MMTNHTELGVVSTEICVWPEGLPLSLDHSPKKFGLSGILKWGRKQQWANYSLAVPELGGADYTHALHVWHIMYGLQERVKVNKDAD